MTDAAITEGDEAQKKSKMPLIVGLVLALTGGAGGFFASSQGLILSSESSVEKEHVDQPVEKVDKHSFAFVAMDPLTISLPSSSRYSHLRFRGELEVPDEHKKAVENVRPRIVDVLNGYLRALEVSDLEAAASLTRLRSQMLRRVQVVAGPGMVNDLLIMEFVLN